MHATNIVDFFKFFVVFMMQYFSYLDELASAANPEPNPVRCGNYVIAWFYLWNMIAVCQFPLNVAFYAAEVQNAKFKHGKYRLLNIAAFFFAWTGLIIGIFLLLSNIIPDTLTPFLFR